MSACQPIPTKGSTTVCSIWDKGYRYGFNGMEKDKDIGSDDYDFGARIYDGRIGRWLSLDPVRNVSWSNYAAYQCSPIAIIDPTGETDYYNISGVWIGTDGDATKTAQIIITDDKISKIIVKTSRKGEEYKLQPPNGSFYELPAKNVIDAIIKTFDQSQTDVKNDKGEVVKPGGEFESGTTFDANGKQTPIVDGAKATVELKAHVDLPESGNISIHTHPTAVLENKLTQKSRSSWADASEEDVAAFKGFKLNIIIGAETQAEYEQIPTPGGGVGASTTVMKPRNIVVNFFSNLGVKLFSINLEALTKINSGDGAKKSKIKEKYDKAKAKNNNSNGTNSQ